MSAKRNNEARSYNHCCGVKAISITYSECVFVDLGTQQATCKRRIAICGLPRSQYFPTLSHKRHDFGKNAIKYKMCVLVFSTTFV